MKLNVDVSLHLPSSASFPAYRKIRLEFGKGQFGGLWLFASHSFKEKIYFKRKAIKQRDVKIKPSLTKHRIELLKDANTLTTGNPGTNFLSAYADVHGNLKIRLKDARNGREVVRFVDEKAFNNLFARSF